MMASENLLQVTEWEVFDLQGETDTLNAAEVIDLATRPSLEKTETYVKDSFQDLKTFQWTPQLAPFFDIESLCVFFYYLMK